MTNIFCAQITASTVTNTDNLVFEIDAPANTTVKIRKISITHGDGTDTTTPDYYKEMRLVRESAAATDGTPYTPIQLDGNNTGSSSTVNTGAFTPGTVSDTIDSLSIHNTTDFYWSAADDEDKIVVQPGGIFGVIVNPAG
jgi:hypothetical protein